MIAKGKTTRDFVFIMKNMLKLTFMDAGSCIRTGFMNCRTVYQIYSYVLNKICSYLSSLLGESFLSSIMYVHKGSLVNICSIIIQMICALTCICVSQILVKDLGFLCSICCHRILTDCFFETIDYFLRNNRLFFL